MNINVVKSVWRHIRRPSRATIEILHSNARDQVAEIAVLTVRIERQKEIIACLTSQIDSLLTIIEQQNCKLARTNYLGQLYTTFNQPKWKHQ